MALVHTAAFRTTLAAAFETAVGASGLLRLWIGGAGVTQAAQITLAADVFSQSVGALTLLGVPLSDTAADANGTINAFSFHTSGGTEVVRGTVTATGGGGDMTVDNPAVVIGQQVQVTSFVYNACP